MMPLATVRLELVKNIHTQRMYQIIPSSSSLHLHCTRNSIISGKRDQDSGTEFNGKYDVLRFVRFVFSSLKCVKDAKPLMDTRIPIAESSVIGTPNAMDVTTIAKRRRMQLRAA